VFPSADEVAKKTVLATLADRAVRQIKFEIDSFRVDPGFYALVAQCMKRGRIRVLYNRGVGTAAYYYPSEDKLELGFTSEATLTRRAIIVHECTHAVFDLRRYVQARRVTSEAAAFIAECLFARFHSPRPKDPDYRLSSDDEKKDYIYELAWEIAGKILKGQTPTPGHYAGLKTAVLDHPDYAQYGRGLSGWDGVRDR
jgi:hypothetical protein